MSDSCFLVLRPAEQRDAIDLLDWRNDPATRANSRNTGEIALETHMGWLGRALADRDRRIWIAEQGGRKLGTVSATQADRAEIEVSITVAPEKRGRGVGAAMLRAAVAETARVWPDRPVRALIRAGNDASRRLFASCGFKAVDEDDGFLVYRWGG